MTVNQLKLDIISSLVLPPLQDGETAIAKALQAEVAKLKLENSRLKEEAAPTEPYMPTQYTDYVHYDLERRKLERKLAMVRHAGSIQGPVNHSRPSGHRGTIEAEPGAGKHLEGCGRRCDENAPGEEIGQADSDE